MRQRRPASPPCPPDTRRSTRSSSSTARRHSSTSSAACSARSKRRTFEHLIGTDASSTPKSAWERRRSCSRTRSRRARDSPRSSRSTSTTRQPSSSARRCVAPTSCRADAVLRRRPHRPIPRPVAQPLVGVSASRQRSGGPRRCQPGHERRHELAQPGTELRLSKPHGRDGAVAARARAVGRRARVAARARGRPATPVDGATTRWNGRAEGIDPRSRLGGIGAGRQGSHPERSRETCLIDLRPRLRLVIRSPASPRPS